MRKLDLSKKSNMKCEHCKYYHKYSKNKCKGANPLGYCELHKLEFKYWNSCNKFIWRDRYIGFTDSTDKDSHYLCRRCQRPLTDPDSIARGFGESCYNKHIKELIRRSRRLF